jgi:hypothetical protein
MSPPDVRFEIRGLRLESIESEYATSFWHRASIVALGDSAAASGTYLVVLRVNRISGGNPELVSPNPMTVIEPVVAGAGDFSWDGGYRSKRTRYQAAETWEPTKIEITVVGFVAAHDLPPLPVRTP